MARDPNKQLLVDFSDIGAAVASVLLFAALIGLVSQTWHWFREGVWEALSLRELIELFGNGEHYVFHGPELRGLNEMVNLGLDSWFGWTFLVLAILAYYLGRVLDNG